MAVEKQNNKTINNVVMGIVENNNNLLRLEQDTSKFGKIVPYLLKKGVDNLNLSMFNPELRNNILIALGEAYRKKGNLHDAARCFILAENKERLNVIGGEYESLLQLDNCIEIYKLSGNIGKLVDIGKKCLNEGKFKEAAKAFIAANYTEGMISVGDYCTEHFKFEQAFEVLSVLKDKKRLARLGDVCVENKNYNYALKSYHLSESKEKLNSTGDLLLREENIKKAVEAYSLANNDEMVIFIKENFAK